ncbi:hypothetical protein N2152v2_000848 [Parachlorella kessleri]
MQATTVQPTVSVRVSLSLNDVKVEAPKAPLNATGFESPTGISPQGSVAVLDESAEEFVTGLGEVFLSCGLTPDELEELEELAQKVAVAKAGSGASKLASS